MRESGPGVLLTGCLAVSSEGNETKKGRKMELANDMTEKRTKAREPFLAISPTMSFVVCSSAAWLAFCR